MMGTFLVDLLLRTANVTAADGGMRASDEGEENRESQGKRSATQQKPAARPSNLIHDIIYKAF